ncbi:MAG: hypothetical protein ACM3JJ_03155 [Hyphomicrobiales bacterium]
MPVVTSGAAARAHLLAAYAEPDAGTRGSGVLMARRGDRREGSIEVRWATMAESTIAIGYAGPVRALDAALLGDSLYLALRPRDLAIAGPVPETEGMGAEGLRFLARPWDLSAPWVREAMTRAAIDPRDGGWRMTGAFPTPAGEHPFALDLDAHGDPRRLRVERLDRGGPLVAVRYGPTKSYRGGRLPQWIEWERGEAVIRLSIDGYARGEPARFRHPPAPDADWTTLSLDDRRARDLIRRYVGEPGAEPEGAP